MKYILLLLLIVPCFGWGQKMSTRDLSPNTVVQGSNLYTIHFDSLENNDSPNDIELIRIYVMGKFSDTIRGWKIEIKSIMHTHGDIGVGIYDIVLTNTKKNKSLLGVYIERLSIYWGGNDDRFEIAIYTAPEEMKRRDSVIMKEGNLIFDHKGHVINH